MRVPSIYLLLLAGLGSMQGHAQTYAERLGWPEGTRALILHVDDAGMSYDSNRGTVRAIEQGIANSLSVMMPTPWVPEIVRWIKLDPDHDAGLHLTLTAEWRDYRWPPLSGLGAKGLVDGEGAMWATVEEVVEHASADAVEREIRAQLARARSMGFEPTHLDSHMGTLFATDAFLERYFKVGIEQRIPVMFPGGPRDEKSDRYAAAIRELRPGVTMMIMHGTDPTEFFEYISDSGESRLGDLEAMLDPELRAVIEAEAIVLTTWRELMARRSAAGG